MAILKAFKGIRSVKDKVKLIASKPYDVLSSEEASIEAKDNPYSFLHVVKPEIDLPPEIDKYSPEVYNKGNENFLKMMKSGLLFQDNQEYLYIYSQSMNGKVQYGLVGCAGVKDYMKGIIKKHELTRPDKEEDRKKHIRITNINAEPVFFAYPDSPEINEIVNNVVKQESEYDFVSDDEIKHSFWIIKDHKIIKKLIDSFDKIPCTYVADGHHRTAAAALVGNERKLQNPKHIGNEEYNYFLAVHFPASQLTILDYNRLVKDLNGLSSEQFIDKLKNNFSIEEKGQFEYKPCKPHNFGMYIDNKWYSLTAKEGIYNENDVMEALDVTILYKQILLPILNIVDLKIDKRIDFVGGVRGLKELKKRVDTGEMKAAFALYHVTMDQLMKIADSGKIMPPKTTWFEPKLRSGLIIHSLN